MTRLLAFWIGIALLMGGAVFATSCGDDDNGGGQALPVDEYFTELSLVANALSDANDASFTTLNQSDDLVELKAAFAALPASAEQFLADLDELEPPDVAEAEHAAALEDGQAFLDRLEEVNGNVQDTENVDDFVATAGDDDLDTLNQSFTAHCVALEGIAADNSIQVDLGCPE